MTLGWWVDELRSKQGKPTKTRYIQEGTHWTLDSATNASIPSRMVSNSICRVGSVMIDCGTKKVVVYISFAGNVPSWMYLVRTLRKSPVSLKWQLFSEPQSAMYLLQA